MTLIEKAFNRLLIPSLLMVFAISISEFVDAMIVARLLGSTAMSIVNLASPIMMLITAIVSLMGVGGSTIYTRLSGSHQPEEARRTYTVTIISMVAWVALFSALMLLLFNPLHDFLCDSNVELKEASKLYVKLLIISGPVIAFANGIIMFLPSAGSPNTGTALIILANVVNLILDVVFIKFCGFGISGAALATVTGYAVSLLIFILLLLTGKISLRFCHLEKKDFCVLGQVCSMGSSSALSQLSFAIKFAFCNAVALRIGGTQGLVALSVCFQLFSIASIFVGGIGSALIRIVAFLKGQKDYLEIRKITSKAYALQLVCSAACTAVFLYFRFEMASLYNVVDPETLKLTAHAISIFSFCILLRGVCINFMFYVQAIGCSTYASFISLLDGFVAIMPIALILCPLIGLDGLWWAFPLYTIVLFLSIVIINTHKFRNRSHTYSGITLVERDAEAEEILYASGAVASNSYGIADIIPDEGVRNLAKDYFEAVTADDRSVVHADLLVRDCRDCLVIEIRTDFHRLCPFKIPEGDIVVKNDMGLGMNTFQIIKPRQ